MTAHTKGPWRTDFNPYAVKCDDCKVTIRLTGSLRESAEGGRCYYCEQDYRLKNWAARLARKESHEQS